MKKLTLPILALAAAVLLGACGTKDENVTPVREPFSVALDWYANPDHAGFFVARDKGYFEDAGLDVSLDAPTDPSLPIKLVAAGRADLAISYEPEVLLARQQGLDVVSVATVIGQPLTSMIWLKKSNIKNVAGLKGKTISTAGISYQDAYLRTILERAGLTENDVKKVGVGQGLLPSILSGKAQATLGPLWNIEGVDLKLSGKNPVVNPVDRLGVPTYSELVLVAKGSRIKEDPELDRALPQGARARYERRRRPAQPRYSDDPPGQQSSRSEDHRGPAGRDPASARPEQRQAALRLHGHGPLADLHQLGGQEPGHRARPSGRSTP